MFLFKKKRKNYHIPYKQTTFKKKSRFNFTKKRKIAIPIKIIVLAVFVFAAIYFAISSDYFTISTINVKGSKNIPTVEILKVVNDEMSKKYYNIIPKNNFFIFNTGLIENAISNKFPEIKSVIVRKIFAKELNIEISEKNPEMIWCRMDSCFYIDSNAVAFSAARDDFKTEKKPIKIIEQKDIEEEIGETRAVELTVQPKAETKDAKSEEPMISLKKDNETKKDENVLAPINLLDKVSDEEFISFVVDLNWKIKESVGLNVLFYKTKGTKTREIIAYTDKNIRLYFDTTESSDLQVNYLKEFLSKGIAKEKINNLKYIYLKSGNKIFYK